MRNIFALSTATTILLFTFTVHAQNIKFDQINQSDLDSIAKEFSANFSHSTVSGASSLGDVFGVEVGLIGGVTKTPEIEKRVKEVDPSANLSQLANAVIAAQVSVPFGITGEVNFFPAIGSESFKYSNMGLGVKWTPTNFLFELPVDLAIKVNYTTTNLSFTQTINNSSTGNTPVDSKVDYKNTAVGYGLFVSKKFVVVEPYLGVGMINGKSDMTVVGSGSIFDTAYTTGNSGSSSPSSSVLTLGVDLSLVVMKLGFEYSSLFGTNRVLGKLALSF